MAPRPEPPARVPWTIVGLLAAALFLNYIDRGVLPTAATLIQDDLGFTTGQLGLLFSAFYWSYALLQVPVGWLAERFGAWQILAGGLALWGCATMLVGAVQAFVALLLLRVLLGIGESAGFPCVSKLLATVVPVGGLGSANGLVSFAYLFGPAVGAYGGGLLMVHFGWRAAFWVLRGTLAAVAAALVTGEAAPACGRTSRRAHPRLAAAAAPAILVGHEPRAFLGQLHLLLHAHLAAVLSGQGARFLDRRDGRHHRQRLCGERAQRPGRGLDD